MDSISTGVKYSNNNKHYHFGVANLSMQSNKSAFYQDINSHNLSNFPMPCELFAIF